MHRPLKPTPRKAALGLLAFLLYTGCSGSGLPGCGALTPLPARYAAAKTDNAVNVRLSPSGINFLNTNWRTLLEVFAPGQKLDFPLGCLIVDAPVLGNIAIADQGSATGSGRLDGKCTAADLPRNIAVTVTGFGMVPRAPDSVQVTLSLQIATGTVYLASTGNSCLLQQLQCSFNFNSARDNNPAYNSFRAVAKFSIDTKWDKLLAFSVTTLDGAKVCGASGALAPPFCLEPGDIDINGENVCGNVACTVADIGIFKSFILGLLSPTLEGKVREALTTQACEQCGAGLPACPKVGTATSTCDTGKGVCWDSVANRCVPRFLGLEGRIAPADLLKTFGVPPEAKLDFSMAGGSSVSVDTGLNIGTRGGIVATAKSDCAPAAPAPVLTAPPAPNFDKEATPGVPYHVGLGVSSPFLNMAAYQAHQSGSLCLSLSSDSIALLNTGLFKTFLPSLGKLATRDGKDAPMRLVVKPKKPPTLSVGQGTYDPTTKKPIKPLILLNLEDVTIDLYALIDERFVRLFSLTSDVSVPLSVIFSGCESVTPALGDLKQLITNIKTANSELLAEDPALLAQLIPALVGLIEPAVATALKPIALPAIAGFKLKVSESKGVGQIGATDAYNHLGLYAQLVLANATCAVAAPTAVATLKRSVIPSAAELTLTAGKPLPWPVAVLDVHALGAPGTAEFSYRVDEGLWTTYLAPNALGELEVSHPRLLIQGVHKIEVRARMAEDPHGISAPVEVPFRVDYEPPEVRLKLDSGALRILARDTVSGDAALEYAFKVGAGALSAFGALRPVDLRAVDAAGSLEVHVRDEAGNVGVAVYRAPVVAEQPSLDAQRELEDGGAGCASAGGGLSLAALALLAAALRRRRAR